ncbi:MAG: strawberry notch-like NTP hydrolase domain-containing protein, partial [Candidatus Ornithomonoglobus sp.]
MKNAQPHPTKISESAAMASVSKPPITYAPNLSQELIEKGVVSDVQLEAISYAGQNHEQTLENGSRKGFFIGDGTGLGKGRIVAGIMLDNRNRGRKKAVWISERPNLYSDAQRDVGAVIGDEKLVHQFEGGKKADRSLDFDDGILFAAYPTLSKGYDKPGSNYEKLVKWLGKDFDGVIAFDEAHNMANSGGNGSRGRIKPSSAYLMGKALQEAFPNARIVYLSATGATEVSNLQYADRLGLWGAGTAFSNAEDFAQKINAGGVAAMELVASNMKENGVYLSRNISYDGVKYDRLTHKLNKQQLEIYGELARGWQIVFQNMNKALEVTNQKHDGMARGRQNSAFWSGQQRFFNQVLTAMKVPTVIKDIEKQLEQGRSAVIQLVTTNEAAQKRESSRIADEGLDLEDFDLTPKQMLMSYVENVFPVEQYETYIDEDGNKRVKQVFDSQGNPVLNADAVKQRDELLTRLGSLKVPSSPIDMIVEHFGTELVAEVTGRSKRIIRKDGKMVEEQRSKSTNAADVDAFQNGNKRILIFSGAGATGKSYHADRNAKNQQQRVHYLLEPGWVANKAVQGFGRSHRSNQATTPIFKLVSTDIKGENRFISTIAKRLSQLGALTKGSAKAGNQGMFTADDDLEGPIASDTLANYYRDLMRDNVVGVKNGMEIIEKLGLKDYLLDQYGAFKESSDAWRDVKKFLNRILVLEPKEQNAVFDGFNERLQAANEIARQNGTLDRGLENYKADGLTIKERKVVHTDSSTGAETTYYNLEARHKLKPIKIENLDTGTQNFVGFYYNSQNKIRAIFRSSTTTDREGKVTQNYKAFGPAGHAYMPEERLQRNWTMIDRSGAEKLWGEELKTVPEYKTNPVHLMTGNLLSIWNKMPTENVRVYRMLTDDGDILLGRVIPDESIDSTLRQLGSSRTKRKVSVSDVISMVAQGDTILLENGWRISQRRVSGENRIEISGPSYYDTASLEKVGVFTERISYNTRYFIPTGAKANDVIKKVFKISPLAGRIESDDNSYSMEAENEEGDILSNGSGERQNGKSSGIEAEGVDRRAGSYKEGRRTAAERRKLGETLKAAGNTEQRVIANVRGDFIKPEAYNDEMSAIAQENESRGLNTEFVVGDLTIAFSGGRKARGVFDYKTNTVIIRYDHSDFSPEQINLHEVVHSEYNTGKTKKVRNIILNSLSVTERKGILRKLAKDYNGIINNNENAVFEEFVANTLAGMNEYTEVYKPVVKAYWSGDETALDNFKVSEYTESIDAGGNGEVLDNIGFGNDYRLSESGELYGYGQKNASEELGRLKNTSESESTGPARMGSVGQIQSQKSDTPHTRRIHRSGVSAETLTSSGLTAEQAATRAQNKLEGFRTEFYTKAKQDNIQQTEAFNTNNTVYYPNSVFERNGIAITNGVASFTEKRFNDLIKEFSIPVGGQENRDYAKGYVTYISPSDFLSLTTVNEQKIVDDTKTNEKYGNGKLDIDRLSGNTQTPFLEVDFDDGVVTAHEGRHRMAMLRDAGIEKVAIVVKDVYPSRGKYRTKKVTDVTVTGQKFNRIGTARGKVTLGEIIPLSPNYRDEVRRKFVDNEADLRYALDTLDDDVAELTPERKKEIFATYDRDNMGAQKKTAVEAMQELKGRIKTSAADIAHSGARVFPEIPERGERGTFFAEFRKNMVQFRALPTTASFVAQDNLNKMTDGLSPADFKTFSQLVYYQDLQEEAQMQQKKGYSEILLPNGIKPGEVNAIVAELQGSTSDNVKAALERRGKIWKELTDTYIKLNQYVGFDTSGRFDRRHY